MPLFAEFTLAAIQAAPVYCDREASTDKACQLIKAAAEKGANLAAFSETWLPGYPFFHRCPAFSPLWREIVALNLANAVEIPSPTTDRLCQAARHAEIDVVMGLVELDPRTRGTIYCTLLFISRDGKILGRHRKLKPTLEERILWGEGDGVGLGVHERPYGRVSGLSCGEHLMLLPSYALMAQGTQIHIAAWPFPGFITDSHPAKGLLLSRAFAYQGGCYVIAVGGLLRAEAVPPPYSDFLSLWDNDKGKGGSCIIAPNGEVIALAPADEETILTASVSLEPIYQIKTAFDIGGHYSRPDILQLQVNRHPLAALVEQAPIHATEPQALTVGLNQAF